MPLSAVFGFMLDVVLPPFCVGCRAVGDWCCTSCFDRIERLVADPCPRCGSLRSHTCESPHTPLAAVVAAGFYHDRTLRGLIHGLKYESATCVLPSLAALLRRMRCDRRDPWPWAGETALVVQPVVCAPSRVRSRGFDQTDYVRELVMREIAPWASPASLLVRRSAHGPQADLPVGPLRAANVYDAFTIASKQPIPDAVLLVDDVFTTGATMREAARVLSGVGVRRIYGFALAMGA